MALFKPNLGDMFMTENQPADDWRAEAIGRGDLEFDEKANTTRVISHPTRAAMLVGKLTTDGGELSNVVWEQGDLIKDGDWQLTALGVDGGKDTILVVTLRGTKGVIHDPQRDALLIVLNHLKLIMRKVTVQTP